MKGILKESYTKSNGRSVFIYYLQGEDSDLADYKYSTGKHYREENGKPLFYTLFYYGKEVTVLKALNKRTYYIRNDEFEMLKSLVNQYGGNLYQELYEKTKDENWLLTEKNEQLLKRKKGTSDSTDEIEEKRTFKNYRGSYAQDIEGYSDQDIDDIFEGDPDMYWNVD